MAYTIPDLPANQRPRQRLLDLGGENLADAELLAIILRTGTVQASALNLAEKLLTDFRGFRGLDSRSAAELCAVPGLGPAKVAQLKAALAIGKKLMSERDAGGKIVSTSRDVFDHVAPLIRDRTREVFWVIFLTARNRIIKQRILFEGTLDESMVSTREVIKEALNEAAAGLVFAHNHPSGEPNPSRDDRDITKKLQKACELVGIRVLDHVIVGGERYFSFAEEGLL